jgi:imidazolonepropionase-like amidohydrolase
MSRPPEAGTNARWALLNARLVDPGTGLVQRGGILLEGSFILAVGADVSEVSVGETRALDLRGRTVLPGLVDCHVHLTWPAGPSPVAELKRDLRRPNTLLTKVAGRCRETLAGGVTTVQDLGGPTQVLLSARHLVASGQLLGPRIVAAGEVVTTPRGHCYFIGQVALTPEEVRSATRRLIDLGVDVVKIIATGGVHTPGSNTHRVQFDNEALVAAVQETQAAGLRITAHSSNLVGTQAAVRAGIRSIQHGGPLDHVTSAQLASVGATLTPTLSTRPAIEAHLGDPRLPRYIVSHVSRLHHRADQATRTAADAGVRLLAGTDAGTTMVAHGSLATEIGHLAQAGLSNGEALCAATAWAAESLGLGAEIGRLAPGFLADLAIVDGNPLADLQTLNSVTAVVRDGRLIWFADMSTAA